MSLSTGVCQGEAKAGRRAKVSLQSCARKPEEVRDCGHPLPSLTEAKAGRGAKFTQYRA